ncbi:MAG: HEPN domain-containing protein [Acidobacteriota bacterium]
MNPPDQVLLTLVRQWIAKADLDYRTAERLLRDAEPIRESIAFHCQQAAEKYLKAFLVCHRSEYPKTHSITRLLDLVSSIAPELSVSLAEAESLTPFGVEIRYPDDFPELLPGQEQTVFDLARRTREAVMAQLEPYLTSG